MAQPVWVLSVDLQAKTATFASGMADAARAARSSFQDIGTSARSGSAAVSEGTIDVRHQLGALDNALRGNHAAAMTDFIRLFQNSGIVMAGLPFAAPIAGFLLLSGTVVETIKKLREMGEAHEKLANDMMGFGTTANNVFGGLNTRILEAQQRADELRNDHLGALKIALELIDHQSMEELVKSFDEIAKASDGVFKDLQGHWYTFGGGSEGASHALNQFKLQYDSLLAQGKDKEASDLLAGTRQSAQTTLTTLKSSLSAIAAAKASTSQWDSGLSNPGAALADAAKKKRLEGEIAAQQQLVDVLSDQVTVEGQIANLNKLDKGNAKTQTGNEAASRQSAAAKEAADSQLRMGQYAIAAERATADAKLTIQRASIEARLQSDLDFASREYAMQEAANAQKIAALNKSDKDYANQLKALQDTALELTAQHDSEVASMTARAATEAAQRDLQNLEQGEREKIDATQQGSAARLTVILGAIKREEAANLQDTDFYRQLLQQRAEATRDEAQQEIAAAQSAIEARRKADMEKNATHLSAQKEDPSAQNQSIQARAQLELDAAQRQYEIDQQAASQQIDLLIATGNTNQAELQKQFNAELAARQKYVDQVAGITHKANAEELNQDKQTYDQLANGYAQSFLKVAEGKQSMARLMDSVGDQMISNMVSQSMKLISQNEAEQLSHARTAAAGAYKSMSGIPYVGPVLGAVAAAAVFAGAMSFEVGGVVPGVSAGDTVPAMLTPGEGVIPKGVMDRLSTMAREGSMGGSHTHVHVHVRPTYHVQTIDGDGMRDALEKHTDVLTNHFENTVRKMNK